MASSENFEENINTFIKAKTGEQIYLDLTTENVIQLKPVCKRGSVPLGAFWVHVFQHSNNYPVYSYPYKRLYHAGRPFELQLRIDGISININLSSGYLIFKGSHVIDWFVSRFLGILEGYALPPGKSSKELRDQYTQEEMEALKRERKICYKQMIDEWPSNALKMEAKIMEAGRQTTNQEPISLEGFLKAEDLETYCPIADLLDEVEVTQQLVKLETGRVIQGNVLYRLWKSTLNSWLSDKDGKVYIITPHIDCDRLVDICQLFLKNRLTACLDTLCIPMSNLYGRFASVRSQAIQQFPPRDQVFIEYKIYSNVVYPVVDFVTSFIAMVKDGKARVLQTNTDFDRASFLTTTSVTVQYKEIDETEFLKAYLDPIIG
ncbi:unnamed protein product [Lymnaea stagnalis]|uniref:Uncharacterized protein n=1 Tax=Lymnaea stagnalis TaxID=6523 RepID=A0AAV2IAG5_LYMST